MRRFSPSELFGIVLQPIEQASGVLERKLGLFSVVIISISAMLGSGLFVLPALAMLQMGGGSSPAGGIWLAYLLAALVILPAAISKSELATAMPVSGGSYVFIERTFGPLIGTISGLGLWGTFMLKSSFALIGFKAYLWVIEDIMKLDINLEYASLILLVLIVVINILGVKRIKKVQTPIVLISTLFLFLTCILAIFTVELNWNAVFSRDAFGSGWESVASTAAFVFVSYAGVTKIAAVGGEIKNPSNNIPKGILLSLLLCSALYVFVTLIMAASVDPSFYMEEGTLHAREDPVYIFANEVGGYNFGILASLLAVLTMTSMALAGIMASSRFLFAMARDSLLPDFLEDVHGKFETPHWAIISTGLAMGLAITFLPVHDVAELASGFQIMIFIIINCSVIILRLSRRSHSWYDPEWKSPLFPFFQVIGIITSAVLLYLMGTKAIYGAVATIILGSIMYYSYGKRHQKPEITPWNTFRLMLINPDQVEHRRRYAAFHAADIEGTNHLNLHEFIAAMTALGYKGDDVDALRSYFHSIDSNFDGVIDIDEFLTYVEETTF
ncbi:MAG: APA family basic amino acid/polyamine antiporter [Candidatus Thalassarchaeaceae archaeon]|jgi:APA family basic amino acid/polyamine antiporter|tara:strand:- start:540 stop:2207 length:1668 start_codon:yes stop_codon:yes gene_type:complete